MDQQAITELTIGIVTIAAAMFFVHTGAISGTVGFGAILAVAGALGAYEARRRRPQPDDTDPGADR